MGAWIETKKRSPQGTQKRSHPTWVRGLKLSFYRSTDNREVSHPTWVRGLKRKIEEDKTGNITSHPTWVRGLKR